MRNNVKGCPLVDKIRTTCAEKDYTLDRKT